MLVPRPTRLSPRVPTSYHSLQSSGLWCYGLWTLSSAGPLLAQRQKQDCGWSTLSPQTCPSHSPVLSLASYCPPSAQTGLLNPLDQLSIKSHSLLHIWQLMNHHHHHHQYPVWCAEGLEVVHQSVTPPCSLWSWSTGSSCCNSTSQCCSSAFSSQMKLLSSEPPVTQAVDSDTHLLTLLWLSVCQTTSCQLLMVKEHTTFLQFLCRKGLLVSLKGCIHFLCPAAVVLKPVKVFRKLT